jgi:hypothetical protein
MTEAVLSVSIASFVVGIATLVIGAFTLWNEGLWSWPRTAWSITHPRRVGRPRRARLKRINMTKHEVVDVSRDV